MEGPCSPRASSSTTPESSPETRKTSENLPSPEASKTRTASKSPTPPKTRAASKSPTPPKTSKTRMASKSPTPPKTSKTRMASKSPTPPKSSKTLNIPKSPECENAVGEVKFKSNLNVLLKRQDEELSKTIEYKEKMEKENKEIGDASQEETEEGEKNGAVDRKKKRKEKHKSNNDAVNDSNDDKNGTRKEDQRKSSEEELDENKGERKKREKKRKNVPEENRRISKDECEASSGRRQEDKKKEKTNKRDDRNEEQDGKSKDIRDEDKNEKKSTEIKEFKDEKKAQEKKKSKDTKKHKENTVVKDEEEKREKVEENKKMEDKEKTQDRKKKKRTEDKEKEEIGGMKKVNTPEDKSKMEDREAGDGVKTRPEAEVLPEQEQHKSGRTQGFLMMKKKGPFSSWKRYYFKLDGHLLTYYRSQQDFGQLSALKGSLDLAMLEEVRCKTPGLMKTHFPFRLIRRNLSSLKLAADTKEERERWLGLLQDILQRCNRLSAHNSDKTLHTGVPFAAINKSDQPEKFATLPIRTVYSAEGAPTSSSSDEGEEASKFIQPKKVPRIPLAGPRINIAEVSLRKVQSPESREQEKQAGDETATKPSDQSDREQKGPREAAGVPVGAIKLKKIDKPLRKPSEDEAGDPEKESQEGEEDTASAGEKFGVKLKKIQTKEGMVKRETAEDKRKEEDFVPADKRRVIKAANIPLHSGSKFLSRSDVSLPKTSPLNQKKGLSERKKSPSPNIPLSKSVHSLTKAAEGGSASPAAPPCSVSTENVQSEDEEKEVNKDFITIHHAENSEIDFSDEVVSIDPDAVIEKALVKEASPASESQEKEAENEDEEQQTPRENDQENLDVEASTRSAPDGEEPPVLVPQESATVAERPVIEPVTDDVEYLENMRKIEDFASASTEKTTPTTREENEYEEIDEVIKEPGDVAPDFLMTSPERLVPDVTAKTPSPTLLPKTSPSPHPSPTTSKAPPSTPENYDDHDYEQFDEDFLEALRSIHKSPTPPGASFRAADMTTEKVKPTPPSSPIRARSGTNDSMSSSGRSDPDTTDKRSSKFNLFKRKRSGSITSGDKKENCESKDSKESKHKGGSSLSKILGKKGKDKKKKEAKDENPKPIENLKESDRESIGGSEHDPEAKPTPAEPERAQDPQRSVDSAATQSVAPKIILSDWQESTEDSMDVEIRYQKQPETKESRCSTYSRASTTSREQDPAPSIPEKTRVRAKSPNHDVPQSNRPVTNLYNMISPQEQGMEDRKLVDGYISEKQIQAILSASEIRDKRRLSQTRIQASAASGSKASDGSAGEDHKRLSHVSITSTESDEPLHATHFLSGEIHSSSSGSFRTRSKSYDSDLSSDSHPVPQDPDSPLPEQDFSTVPLRTTSRLAESLTVGNRISLTSPEFTVVEEDGPGTPDATKTTFPLPREHEEDPNSSLESSNKPTFTLGDEDDEKEDYFPVVGGDVELRLPRDLYVPKPSAEDMRTSGIAGLKEYLNTLEPQDDATEVKSSISRLGHSAAVEKLKETSTEF